MEVLTRPVALSSEHVDYALAEGLTVDEILRAVSWSDAMRAYTVVLVDGLEIDRAHWARVRPKQGTKLFVGVRPSGGKGGGKQIVMAVAAIAIMIVAIIVAPYLAPLIGYAGTTAAGGLTLASQIIAGGLAIAGNLALAALIRPAIASNPLSTAPGGPGGNSAERQGYGLSGAGNPYNPYGVVAKVWGRHRVSPTLAAETYIVAEGGLETAYLLLDFGEGPILMEDLRIGATPVGQFPGVRYHFHTGYVAGQPVYYYSRDAATARIDSNLALNAPVIRLPPQPGRAFAIELRAPRGMYFLDHEGNMRATRVELEIHVSEDGGIWHPIQHVQGWLQYKGDDGTAASGTGQRGLVQVVKGYKAENALRLSGVYANVNDAMQMSDGSYHRIIAVSGLENNEWFPGSLTYYARFESLPSQTEIQWMEANKSQQGLFDQIPTPAQQGAWVAWFDEANPGLLRIEGKTATAQAVTVNFTMPYEAAWMAQVVMRTETFVGASSVNQIAWTTFRAMKDQLPIRPKTPRGILEMRISASQDINGQISQISALVSSMARDWEGNLFPSRNPCWHYLDMLTGPASPRPVPWSEIDIERIIRWGEWCDSPSPQGDPRCRADMLITDRETVGELAQQICAIGRATPVVRDGKYSVITEVEQRVPVQLFNERNTRGLTATHTWPDLPHALRTRYLNENTWERDEIVVYRAGYDATNATRFETLDLKGIVRGWQAWRETMYYLSQATLRREVIEFDCDIEQLACQRGDMVLVSHDMLYGSIGARVMDVGTNHHYRLDVLIDTAPPNFSARVRYADNTVSAVVPAQMAGSTGDLIYLPLPRPATEGDLLVLGEGGKETSEWIVDALRPGPDFSASVSLIERRPEIMDADSGVIPDYVPPGGSGILAPFPAVTGLHLYYNEIYIDKRPVYQAALVWQPPANAGTSHYEVYDDAVLVTTVAVPVHYFNVDRLTLPRGGQVRTYGVIAVSVRGSRSPIATVSQMWLPETVPPPMPRWFSTNVLGETVLLMWTQFEAWEVPDLAHWEIRFSDDINADWAAMAVLVRVAGDTLSTTSHARTGRYAIAAVDTSGNYSLPAYSGTVIERLPNLDFVLDSIGHPDWPGRYEGVELHGSELRLSKQADGTYPLEGWWYSARTVSFPDTWTMRLFESVLGFGVSLNDVIASWVPIALANPLQPFFRGRDWDATMYVRIGADSPTLASDHFVPLATAAPLAGATGRLSPWTRLVASDFTFDTVEWALRLESHTPGVTPSVTAATLRVDVVERREFGGDVMTQPGGTRVNFGHAFYNIPTLAITQNSAQAGDRVVRTVDRQGFTVEIFNGAASVARLIDWAALGYGEGEAL